MKISSVSFLSLYDEQRKTGLISFDLMKIGHHNEAILKEKPKIFLFLGEHFLSMGKENEGFKWKKLALGHNKGGEMNEKVKQ